MWGEPVLRIEGPLGSGKSRLIWEALQSSKEPNVWATCGGEHAAPGVTLANQLFSQLLANPSRGIAGAEAPPRPAAEARPALSRQTLVAESLFLALRVAAACEVPRARTGAPVRMVIDGVESASASERELVSTLFDTPQFGRAFHLVLIGRSASTWPDRSLKSTLFNVPPLALTEAQQLCQRLTQGLSMPAEIADRLLEATAGNPFALEESLHELIHRQALRRIYGSFFFNGDASTGFEPSNRWVCHVVAEAGRLGSAAPMRTLALAHVAVPPGDLGRVVGTGDTDEPIPPDWHLPLVDAGWLRAADTPWGPGSRFRAPRTRRPCLDDPRASASGAPPSTSVGRSPCAIRPAEPAGRRIACSAAPPARCRRSRQARARRLSSLRPICWPR